MPALLLVKQVGLSATMPVSVQPRKVWSGIALSHTAPTASTSDRQAGAARLVGEAWLPDDTVISVPLAATAAAACASAIVQAVLSSQAVSNSWSVPRLRLTTFASGCWLAIQSSAATMSAEVLKRPWSSSMRTTTVAAAGAPPCGDCVPSPVTMPVTLVPWPLPSAALPAPLCVSEPFGQQPTPGVALEQKHCWPTMLPARSGWSRRAPESTTTVFTPWPTKPRARTSLTRASGAACGICAPPPTSRSTRTTSACARSASTAFAETSSDTAATWSKRRRSA